MRIGIVTPAPLSTARGNVVTARRWACVLAALGHTPRLLEVAAEPDPSRPPPPLDDDLLIALHARRSAPAALAWRAARPSAPLVVALTGTDLYADLPHDATARAALEAADRLVVLQAKALEALPAPLRARARVIHQGVTLGELRRRPPDPSRFEALVLAHLRPVKAPLLIARAAARAPADSRLQAVLLGEALDPTLGRAAEVLTAREPRFSWLGPLPRAEALARLAGASALVSTSHLEGGANAVGEALALGVPVLATPIDGALGLLGDDYPGLFPVDDDRALADALLRLERDADWRGELTRRCAARGALVEPAAEQAAWRDLLGELDGPTCAPPPRART